MDQKYKLVALKPEEYDQLESLKAEWQRPRGRILGELIAEAQGKYRVQHKTVAELSKFLSNNYSILSLLLFGMSRSISAIKMEAVTGGLVTYLLEFDQELRSGSEIGDLHERINMMMMSHKMMIEGLTDEVPEGTGEGDQGPGTGRSGFRYG